MQLRAVIGCGTEPDLVAAVQRLRKAIFVERCGWDLEVRDGREVDQFDAPDAVHALVLADGRPVATFRATRTDRPYLAAEVFPSLAVVSRYPRRADTWEVSRFGIAAGGSSQIARLNYALMFWFAQRVGARSLVAIADLTYERFLRSIGIRTRRFGPPQAIGVDRHGRKLMAVAGEIPLAAQSPAHLSALLALTHHLEITDASDVCGSARVSA
jgi:acyl homoserine lactone synthase